MADIKTLFHNPEAFSDADLKRVHSTLNSQRYTALFGTLAGGLGAFTVWNCPKRVAVFATLGYTLGGYYSYKVKENPRGYEHVFDNDIIKAFEQRYINLSLNASGYGNNALNMANQGAFARPEYKKLF